MSCSCFQFFWGFVISTEEKNLFQIMRTDFSHSFEMTGKNKIPVNLQPPPN